MLVETVGLVNLVEPVVSWSAKWSGDSLLGKRENSAGFMDYFAGDNQLVFKLTRQF